jgi:hypothetical protein
VGIVLSAFRQYAGIMSMQHARLPSVAVGVQVPIPAPHQKEILMRDLEKNPYTADEQRVARFFFDKGVGGGDDPIGSLMASHEYLVAERNELRVKLRSSNG